MPQIQYPLLIGPSKPATTFIFASDIGCRLDVDLDTGINKYTGGSATDDGPLINAVLSSASADNPITLVIDGSACVSGIFGPAGGHWGIVGYGWDTGFYMKSASNNHVITNGTSTLVATDPGGAAPARGAHMLFRDFRINGNRGNGVNGNSNSGDPRGPTSGLTWLYGIRMVSMDHITIENVRFFNISAYNLMLSNCGDVSVVGCHFESAADGVSVGASNTDGCHVDGPGNDLRIVNCFFRTGDDSIALNSPEGYGGLIQRVTVANCTAFQSQTLMRIYTGSGPGSVGGAQPLVDSVSVTNYNGSANLAGLLLGVELGNVNTKFSTITNIKWSNSVIQAPLVCVLMDNIGNVDFENVTLTGATGIPSSPLPQWSFFEGGPSNVQVDSLSATNCTLVQTTAGPYANGILSCVGGFQGWGVGVLSIKRLNVNGVKLVYEFTNGETPIPNADLIYLGSSTIGHLQLDAVDSTNITALVDDVTKITTMSGAGLLASAWPVPASRVMNGSMFLDSTSNVPRINVGGVAKTFTLT